MSATHISSLTAAVTAAIERRDVAGPVNVADATPTTAADLLGTLFETLDLQVRIVAIPAPLTWTAAAAAETIWRLARRTDEPAVTRFAVAGLARPFTLELGRLHRELGVHPDIDVERAAERLAETARPDWTAIRSS
jgi:nucleoside-diphosphate-sugar epimerase